MDGVAQRSGSATLRPRTGSCRRFKCMTHIESAMLGLVVFVGSFLGVTLYHQERILAELVGRMSGAAACDF